MHAVIAFVLFLCWGSFLNVVAYRLIAGHSIIAPRSFCPHCKQQLAWYDLIPVFSWLWLRGSCRSCKEPISSLYIFTELLTAVVFTALVSTVLPLYWFGYGIFFSALIVTIRTDLETMLISRFMTLYLVPVGILLSFLGLLPLDFFQSCIGAAFGYGIVWLIAQIFYQLKKIEGMGEGDFELLSCIGAFTGPVGVWLSLLLGSLLALIGAFGASRFSALHLSSRIPFGPALAGGALIYVFFQKFLVGLLL